TCALLLAACAGVSPTVRPTSPTPPSYRTPAMRAPLPDADARKTLSADGARFQQAIEVQSDSELDALAKLVSDKLSSATDVDQQLTEVLVRRTGVKLREKIRELGADTVTVNLNTWEAAPLRAR